ncbi:MAG: LVIVD repeat-containing protein, partial [Blastocatellia bacterium]
KVARTLGMLGVANPNEMPKSIQAVRAQLAFANSDLAFQGRYAFMGNFYGVNIYDIANPAKAKLVTSMICPGGQGDVSVYKNLMFMSVEMPNGRLDCGVEGFPPTAVTATSEGPIPAPQKERFRGVRIFDISNIQRPRQVAAVQTCRGSHTHTLVVDPKDSQNVYIYVSGTSFVRQSEELAGCSGEAPERDPNTSLFRIEVIQVPVASPEKARVVASPRVFMDPRTGVINALNSGGSHDKATPVDTDQCHDITVYSKLGLAAGACSGNGILLDISKPAEPKRIDAVNDPNYAYWHSATFSNDGSKVVFTDEWGGGLGARCRPNDPNKWGANAIFLLKENRLSFISYYKLPAAQGDNENCVAHNGSLIPVPGRDIKVQAWYQGGISIMDFTIPEKPVEIAYFDRGPVNEKMLVLGGPWSTYWYNGYIYSSEIARGLDILELIPSEFLTQNEIDAARSVRVSEFNVQNQQQIVWPRTWVVAKAYLDQLERSRSLSVEKIKALRQAIGAKQKARLKKMAQELREGLPATPNALDAKRIEALAGVLEGI